MLSAMGGASLEALKKLVKRGATGTVLEQPQSLKIALAAADPTTSRSLVASRVSQALSVALQSAVAFNILDYVYTKIPKGRKGTIAVQPGGADWDHRRA